MIDQARWDRIQMLFDEALELPGPEQTSYVNSAGVGDTAVIVEVLAMLKQIVSADPFWIADYRKLP